MLKPTPFYFRGLNMFTIKKNLALVVEQLLEDIPALRDNDHRLFAHVLNSIGVIDKERSYTGLEILQALASGIVPPIESITRARRKLQEKRPELRGKSYYERQNHAGRVAKKMLSRTWVGEI